MFPILLLLACTTVLMNRLCDGISQNFPSKMRVLFEKVIKIRIFYDFQKLSRTVYIDIFWTDIIVLRRDTSNMIL